jgi:hypothetical protein
VSKNPRAASRVAALLLASSLSVGCAFADRDNRRTLNYLDAHAAPTSAAARWALSPVALPAAIGAGALDAVVVHPATQFDDAWRDTVELLWDYERDSSFRAVLLTPLSAVATPVVYSGDWLLRSVFDVDDDLAQVRDEAASTREGSR